MNLSNDVALDTKPLDEILNSNPDANANCLITLLQEIQKAYGYLQAGILQELSTRTGIPASQVYGVATFYEQFHMEPHGRHTIRCCRGTACHVKGSPKINVAIERLLNIKPGQTSQDMRFTFETVACLGTCFLAPVMMVNDDYYGHLTAEIIDNILESYK